MDKIQYEENSNYEIQYIAICLFTLIKKQSSTMEEFEGAQKLWKCLLIKRTTAFSATLCFVIFFMLKHQCRNHNRTPLNFFERSKNSTDTYSVLALHEQIQHFLPNLIEILIQEFMDLKSVNSFVSFSLDRLLTLKLSHLEKSLDLSNISNPYVLLAT